ncbi:GerAB/ArcD/ProY family transporter [Tumebacillus lipolyticus]|uniref:Endospore germination permease n=1 Tax=Tumebacillus lipolyticus TaxID=1280370 RepID=A0ABW5A0C7_9BACL
MKTQVEKISGSGLFALLFMFLVGSAIILPRGSVAGHDNWLSHLLAIIAGLGATMLIVSLYQKHPGLSFIEIAETQLGNLAGRLIGLLYAWYALHLGALVMRNLEELTLTVVLPKTPPLMVKATLFLLLIWIVYEGIEVICRCAQAIMFLVILLLCISYLLQASDMNIDFFLPLLDRGWSPVLEGALQIFSFPFGEAVLFAMIFPYLQKSKDASPAVRWAILIAGFVLLADTVRNVLVFSELSDRLQFPSFLAFSYISVADFLERLEPLAFVVWMLCGFLKISVCLFVCSDALSRTLKSNSSRTFLFPLGLLLAWLSQLHYRNQAEMYLFKNEVWPYYSLPFQLLIPLTLLLVSINKKSRST